MLVLHSQFMNNLSKNTMNDFYTNLMRFSIQWRNSHELYLARACRGTQTIGLSGGHPDLSCPRAVFIQFPFRFVKHSYFTYFHCWTILYY